MRPMCTVTFDFGSVPDSASGSAFGPYTIFSIWSALALAYRENRETCALVIETQDRQTVIETQDRQTVCDSFHLDDGIRCQGTSISSRVGGECGKGSGRGGWEGEREGRAGGGCGTASSLTV